MESPPAPRHGQCLSRLPLLLQTGLARCQHKIVIYYVGVGVLMGVWAVIYYEL